MENKDRKYLDEMESFIQEQNRAASAHRDYLTTTNINVVQKSEPKWQMQGTFEEPKMVNNNDDYEFNKLSNAINSIEESIENSEGFDEEEISRLKEKIKIFEDKLKEKVKPKTITISKKSHDIIKNYCNFYNVKIGDWVEKILLEKIDEQTPKNQVITRDEQIKDIKDKYKNDIFRFKVKKKLIMTEKYIGVYNDDCVRKNFKLVGINLFKKPVYEYIGNDYENDISSITCGIYEYKEGDAVNTFAKYQKEFDEIEIDNGMIDPVETINSMCNIFNFTKMELKNDEWVTKLGDINPKTTKW